MKLRISLFLIPPLLLVSLSLIALPLPLNLFLPVIVFLPPVLPLHLSLCLSLPCCPYFPFCPSLPFFPLSPSAPASRSAPTPRNARPTHSATYWRSATPLPTSTLPRHLAPLSPSPHPSRPYPHTAPSSYHSSQYSNRDARIAVAKHYPLKNRERFSGNKNSILVLGDSNTRHIKLFNEYDLARVLTFLIQDIDPTRCKGYGRVWIHCGINNLRYNRCTSYSDVKNIFKIFMNKLSAIRNMCPETKIYVSPHTTLCYPRSKQQSCVVQQSSILS